MITIKPRAFAFCNLLTSVTLGSNITSIGTAAFWDCDGLTEITIPNSVISIDKAAFSHCDGLRKVTIGESVATIGSGAFDECSHLVDVYIKAATPPVLYYGYCDIYGQVYGSNNLYVFYPGGCTIYVPLFSLNKYKTDWNKSYYVNCLEGYEFN